VKRLLLDCSVVLLVVGGAYFWRHPVSRPRAPAVSGAMPDLSMPENPALRTRTAVDSAQYVVRETAGGRERPLGSKPRLLGPSAVDAAAGSAPDALPDERSPWSDRLRRPWALGAVAALFILLYAVLTRALRKGPGGHGFTHD
jgi:hypothetical protein